MKMFFCRNQWENSHLPKVRWRSVYCQMAISLIYLSGVFIYFFMPPPHAQGPISAFMPYLPGRIECRGWGELSSAACVSAFTAVQVMNETQEAGGVGEGGGVYGRECKHPFQPPAPACSSRAPCFPQVPSERSS